LAPLIASCSAVVRAIFSILPLLLRRNCNNCPWSDAAYLVSPITVFVPGFFNLLLRTLAAPPAVTNVRASATFYQSFTVICEG